MAARSLIFCGRVGGRLARRFAAEDCPAAGPATAPAGRWRSCWSGQFGQLLRRGVARRMPVLPEQLAAGRRLRDRFPLRLRIDCVAGQSGHQAPRSRRPRTPTPSTSSHASRSVWRPKSIASPRTWGMVSSVSLSASRRRAGRSSNRQISRGGGVSSPAIAADRRGPGQPAARPAGPLAAVRRRGRSR